MRFIDKIRLGKKSAAIALPRNLRSQQQSEKVHIQFVPIPCYIGLFFDGIANDPNTKQELKAFADASEEQLDEICKTLAFWWFYWLDRTKKDPSEIDWSGELLLNDPYVREGFEKIWDLSGEDIARMRMAYDTIILVELFTFLWEHNCTILEDNSLSFLFVTLHIRNAQARMLKDPEGVLRQYGLLGF